jgi:hypothetical protein
MQYRLKDLQALVCHLLHTNQELRETLAKLWEQKASEKHTYAAQ